MNCFGEIFKLSQTSCDLNSFKFFNNKPFIKSNDFLYLCHSTNLFSKYDLSTSNKPMALKSWSFTELNRLLLPPIIIQDQDKSLRNRMLSLHTFNTLIEWNIQDDDKLIEKFRKNFSIEIIHLLNNGLIVFANGWITSYERLKQDEYFSNDNIQSIIDRNEKIEQIESNNKIIYYRTVNNRNGKMYIYRLEINNDQIESSTKTEINKHCYQVFGFDGQRIVGVVDNVNQIDIYELLTENKIYQFEKLTSPSKNLKICSMTITQNGCFAFLLQQDEQQKFLIDVYHCDYQTLIGSIPLTMMMQKQKIFLNKFYSLDNDDTLLLFSEKFVLFIPITNPRPLLSQLLTKNLLSQNDSNSNLIRISNENFILKEQLSIDFIDGNGQQLSIEQLIKINENFDKILKKMNNLLPEEILSKILLFCTRQFMLIKDKDKDLKKIDEIKKIFQKLILIPINEIFMISCLKSTATPSIIECLFAIEWIIERLPNEHPIQLSWLSILFDLLIQYKQLIYLRQDLFKKLHQIRQRIIENIEFFEQLSSIEPMIELLGQQQQQQQFLTYSENNVGDYCIELLTIF